MKIIFKVNCRQLSTTILFYSVSLRSVDLTCIFNQSLLNGIYPFDWKLVEVSPIFKNVSKTADINNFRPRYPLYLLCPKSLKIIYDQQYNYPNVNVNVSLLTICTATLAFALYTVRSRSCWRVATTGFSMLPKKAFDSIDHKITLQKRAK